MLGKLNTEQIEYMLQCNTVGRIGCHADGKTYIVPVTYVYDGESIIGHSGDGMKIAMLRKNPECCFELDHMTTNMANWQSVIAWGKFEELHGNDATEAMQKLINRLQPTIASETSHPSHHAQNPHATDIHLIKAVVYKIHLREKTGRFEKT